MTDETEYGLSAQRPALEIPAPELDYRPPRPHRYRPQIGLIGAGGISEFHLKACLALGLEVAIICNRTLEKARQRRDAFYPGAEICSDYRRVLDRSDIEIVDITTHPEERFDLIANALRAGKHVLSQKPFVTDLDRGAELVALADSQKRLLAVNQNGRWAPHFAWLAAAMRAGVLGEPGTVDFILHFDHTWTAGTRFDRIHQLILYDFGIHWFDMALQLVPGRNPERVYASAVRAPWQTTKPPFLAHAVIDFPGAQVRFLCNAHTRYGQEDRTVVAGSLGTAQASGPSVNEQRVALWTKAGLARPALEGDWFSSGFQGAMGELLLAIEENRQPSHSAAANLASLALCFAAVQSAGAGVPVAPGSQRRLPAGAG
ncbi:MAG TPA: Gfo/Idh/MocA family oxidoreductase [Verrucomicrobiales bacterium]|nr:Gfo/Idh/MocA family oxidoreductase [Verrucomicrobiales bacterium]